MHYPLWLAKGWVWSFLCDGPCMQQQWRQWVSGWWRHHCFPPWRWDVDPPASGSKTRFFPTHVRPPKRAVSKTHLGVFLTYMMNHRTISDKFSMDGSHAQNIPKPQALVFSLAVQSQHSVGCSPKRPRVFWLCHCSIGASWWPPTQPCDRRKKGLAELQMVASLDGSNMENPSWVGQWVWTDAFLRQEIPYLWRC